MSEPLIPDKSDVKALADRFRAMADKIELNGITEFGGAFVIIPPAPGEAIETFVMDKNQDPAQFFVILKTKAEMALAGLDQIHQNQGFARR